MQSAFDEYRRRKQSKPSPDLDIDNDDESDEWVRETGETLYHPVGTCKMGNDDMAVVDDNLKVKGIDNKSCRRFNNAYSNRRQYQCSFDHDC